MDTNISIADRVESPFAANSALETPGAEYRREAALNQLSTGQANFTIASPYARKLQRSVAFLVVVLPFLGFITALFLIWKNGIGFLEVGLLAVMYVVTMIGETVGYHRLFSHRAFKTSKSVRALLAILGSMTGQGPVVFFVATHRRHHAYSDQQGDPHSPNLHGEGRRARLRSLWHSHIGWMFSDEITSWTNFARDILQDKTLLKIHRQYFFWLLMGLLIPALAGGLLTRSWAGLFTGFLWGGLVRIFLVNQAMWCVGSICHRFGRSPFKTQDLSTNNYLVAFFTFGEGLQNNHHAFPNSAWHGVNWWEPDFSGWFIRLLERLGLVWDVRVPKQRDILAARKSL